MTVRRDLPPWWMLARIKVKLGWYIAERALCRAVLRLMRRLLDWMEPAA